MSHAQGRTQDVAGSARLLVIFLGFAWGFNWVATALALREVPPWSLRFAGTALGATTLFGAGLLNGYDLKVPRGQWRHVVVAGMLNVVAFNILSAFAVLTGATARVVIIVYSMPIWSTLLSRLLLGERLNAVRIIAFVLCVIGLAFLIGPQITHGLSVSVFLSLGCAWCWALATVYIKWVKADIPPLANAAWQMLLGTVLIGIGMLVVDHYPHLWPIHAVPLAAVIYIGVCGVGLAHFLWWSIVAKLPAITASIGALLVPVVGVTGSTLILGERPTLFDVIGFATIFAAAACVLLQPNVKHEEMPE